MLSPRHQPRPLMPQDKRIMALLDLDARTYREFLVAAERATRLQASRDEPQAFLFGLGAAISWAIVNFAIGVALTAASALLAPRPKTQSNDSPEIRREQVDGQSLVRGDRFGAKSGFDSVQNVVELGSIVPMVYANREIHDGIAYGGIRINTDLLWSQLLSIGGNQMFRGIFLLGQGGIEEIDAEQFAIGDNLLTGFGADFDSSLNGRLTIYGRLDGGRITTADYLIGRQASEDPGAYGTDVYVVPDATNTRRELGCYTARPSNQTAFGLHGAIGACLSHRLNPQLKPLVQLQVQPRDNNEVNPFCAPDAAARVNQMRYRASFHNRCYWSGISGDGDYTIEPNTEVTLVLDDNTDAGREFRFQRDNSNGDDYESEQDLDDIAQSIAARQAQYDDNLVVGERYMLGDGLAICVSRSDNQFVSEAGNSSNDISVSATFRTLEQCTISNYRMYDQDDPDNARTSPLLVGSANAQVFRAAIATFTLGQKAQTIEIGIRSTVGISINGLCNFSTCWSQEKIDSKACEDLVPGGNVAADTVFPVAVFTSGTIRADEERYSCFRFYYRRAGSGDDWTVVPRIFSIRSSTNQPIFNYLRAVLPAEDYWEIQLRPVSGWDVRRRNGDPIAVVDYKYAETSMSDAGVVFYFRGQNTNIASNRMAVSLFDSTQNLEIAQDGSSFVDAYAKLAELFIYDEITSSVQSGPEHEVVYVNTIIEQPAAPYTDLAIIGLNIQAGRELNQLNQLSAYVTKGLQGTHLFPEIYRDMLTNSRYQARGLLSPMQIDDASFQEAAAFCLARRYFCDLGLSEPINRREWGAETANNFLLDLVTRNGKVSLQPTFYFDKAEPITALFTAGNVVEDSIEVAVTDVADRRPVRVSVRWRQEREATTLDERGLFPVIREVTVAEAATPANAEVVRVDLTDYCTSEQHAIDVGKLRCLVPVLQRRTIRLRTWPQAGTVIPGRCFKVGMETIVYDSPSNGAITADGTVTSWPPLADGDYDVLLWQPGVDSVQETSITITDGKSSPVSAVFCLRQTSAEALTFKATRVELNEDGEVEVEGVEFPVDENGISLFVAAFSDAARWSIEGNIYPVP